MSLHSLVQQLIRRLRRKEHPNKCTADFEKMLNKCERLTTRLYEIAEEPFEHVNETHNRSEFNSARRQFRHLIRLGRLLLQQLNLPEKERRVFEGNFKRLEINLTGDSLHVPRIDSILTDIKTIFEKVKELGPTYVKADLEASLDRPSGDEAIRFKILETIYLAKRRGQEIQMSPQYYARVLNISDELASFNIEYLIQTGLIEGHIEHTTGPTPKRILVDDITAFGIKTVEDHTNRDAIASPGVINVNPPITQRARLRNSIVYPSRRTKILAVVMLILAIVSTTYTVLTYYKPEPSERFQGPHLAIQMHPFMIQQAFVNEPITFNFSVYNDGDDIVFIYSIYVVDNRTGKIAGITDPDGDPQGSFFLKPDDVHPIHVSLYPEKTKTTKNIEIEINYGPGLHYIESTQTFIVQWIEP